MPKKSSKIPSFFDWLLHTYLREVDRYCLADNMKRLAPRYPELKQIDSLSDLMIASACLTDPDARNAELPEIWAEYCARVGRPIVDTE